MYIFFSCVIWKTGWIYRNAVFKKNVTVHVYPIFGEKYYVYYVHS